MKILHSNLIGDSERHLFIIHGFLGMGDNWKSHAKKISEYNYTVHLIDLRNHGRSFGIISSHLKLWSMIFKTMLFSIKSKNSIYLATQWEEM